MIYYVYILASKIRGTLYIGVTNDIKRRVFEYKNKITKGFTEKYCVNKLVYFEDCGDIKGVIQREKALKSWNRKWKIDLIEKTNPGWRDLFDDIW